MSPVPHPPSGRFLLPWFPHLGPGPKMAPPREVPGWVSGYRPFPWGTVMQPTCQMFLSDLVEDFCALGFATWGLGPRWHPRKGVPRWVSGYMPSPWGTVMQPTCHMFVIHLVEDFCALGFPTWSLGPRWDTPRGVPRWVSGYRPAPWGTVMEWPRTGGTALSDCGFLFAK